MNELTTTIRKKNHSKGKHQNRITPRIMASCNTNEIFY